MKADAYAFAAEVDREIEGLSNADYLRRSGRAKKLCEELLPLSRLGLRMKQPGLSVMVEAIDNDGPADGIIKIAGFCPREFEVQLTFAGYEYEEALRAEALVRKGHIAGAGPIRRNKNTGEIIASMAAVDHEEHFERVAQAILARVREKSRNTYGAGAVLIVAFEEVKLYGCRGWSRLLSILESDGAMSRTRFSQVFLFNAATNEFYAAA